jgi:hypothetical protein
MPRDQTGDCALDGRIFADFGWKLARESIHEERQEHLLWRGSGRLILPVPLYKVAFVQPGPVDSKAKLLPSVTKSLKVALVQYFGFACSLSC